MDHDPVDDLRRRFGTVDYVVFVFTLVVSVVIGVYYGFFGKSGGVKDYLVGDRQMKPFPVAMSVLASTISGLSLQAFITEIYIFGVRSLYMSISFVVSAIWMHWLFLPVLYELKLTSSYEYLELRFNKTVRTLASVMFLFDMVVTMPMVIFGSVIGISQVTGLSMYVSAPVLSFVCIFYTCVGGAKAVVWTDVVQMMIIFVSTTWIVVKGTVSVGGLDVVWSRGFDSGRIELPSLSMDMTDRNTLMAILFGGSFFTLSLSFSQLIIQRYVSLPSLGSVKLCLWIQTAGLLVINLLVGYAGLVVYAAYHDCDPFTTKLATLKDQLLSLFVMQTLGEYPGASGLLIAALLSAGLSTLSSGYNSVAAVILEDFVKTFRAKKVTERSANYIVKSAVVILGVVSLCPTFFMEKLGPVFQVSFSLLGVTRGPIVGIYIAGMMIPWINSKGVMAGASVAIAVMAWIVFGAQAAIASGLVTFPEKPVSTLGCAYNFSVANSSSFEVPQQPTYVLPVYRLSFLWYAPVGISVTLLVSAVVSCACGCAHLADLDAALVVGPLRRFVPSYGEEDAGSRLKRDGYQDKPTIRMPALDFVLPFLRGKIEIRLHYSSAFIPEIRRVTETLENGKAESDVATPLFFQKVVEGRTAVDNMFITTTN